MLGAPVIGIGLMMVNYLGVENHPELASAYLIAANVINLVLDYIFLRYTPLGITGASLSTVLGFLFAMGIFVLYIRSDKRNLHLILLKPGELGITKEAIITGVPMPVSYTHLDVYKRQVWHSISGFYITFQKNRKGNLLGT